MKEVVFTSQICWYIFRYHFHHYLILIVHYINDNNDNDEKKCPIFCGKDKKGIQKI